MGLNLNTSTLQKLFPGKANNLNASFNSLNTLFCITISNYPESLPYFAKDKGTE
jgi:hypothetical protein